MVFLNDILLVRQRTTRISFFNILFFSNDGALNVWKKNSIWKLYVRNTYKNLEIRKRIKKI